MDPKLQKDLAENRPVKVRPLARAANRSFSHFYGAIKRGEIRVIRVGRSLTVPPDEARRLLGLEAKAA